jgi:FtsP/CotA-like multicopper oxidase with cupredoxin domain
MGTSLCALFFGASFACTGTDLGNDAGRDDDDELLTCTEEHECHDLGPGAMCMGGRCMRMDPPPVVVVPDPRDVEIDIAPLIDTNPDPAVFDGTLIVESAPLEIDVGVSTPAFVYRDGNALTDAVRSPGPRIDVVEGTLVRITVVNDLDEPTTVHWHGLILPIEMDGVPDMPLPPIAPGESFTYVFEAKNPALYWYHPHFRSDVQNERGLHGPFVIRPSVAEPVVDAERILVLDDILLDDDGAITGPEEGSSHHVADDGELLMTWVGMMGRQGNRLLVNGVVHPRVPVKRGTVERWRIVNSANARFFLLALDGHTFTVVGSDAGPLANARTVEEILLAPSERVDVLVEMTGAVGSSASLVTRPHDRGHNIADPVDYTVLTLAYDDDEKSPASTAPDLSAPVQELVESAAPHQIVQMNEELVRGGRVGFSLNEELWPDVTPLLSTTGATETWELENRTHMEHPFHLHGTRFQVTSRGPLGGPLVPVVEREWKDTVVVEGEETVRFVTTYEEYPGHWMFHCHIFEHGENGMMGMIEVSGSDDGTTH